MSASYFTPENLEADPENFRAYLSDDLFARASGSPGRQARVVLGNWAEWKGIFDPANTQFAELQAQFSILKVSDDLPGEPDEMIGVFAVGVLDPRTGDWQGEVNTSPAIAPDPATEAETPAAEEVEAFEVPVRRGRRR